MNLFATKEFEGVRHVWDVHTGSWVTEEYWEWVIDHHRYETEEAPVRTYDPES